MYFKDRADAGRQLAHRLAGYKNKNCIVIALSKEAMIVGAQIAMELHASLALYLVETIHLPGEPEAIGALSSTGTFAYNTMLSPQEIESAVTEFHGYIDQQRLEIMHKLNVLVGTEGEIDKRIIRRHIVILVSDGLSSGFAIKLATDYLKTVSVQKVVIATPLATVHAVDSMHLLGDELHCLNVVVNYFGNNHYYDDNSIPPLDGLFAMMRNISLTWRQKDATLAELDEQVSHRHLASPNPPPTSGHGGRGSVLPPRRHLR